MSGLDHMAWHSLFTCVLRSMFFVVIWGGTLRPLQFGEASACESEVIYVRLADSGALASSPCGNTSAFACRSISGGVKAASCAAVRVSLLSSRFDAPLQNEILNGARDVVIDGSHMGRLHLNATDSDTGTWLTIQKSNGITLTSLDISMEGFSGRSGVLFISCRNLTLENLTFSAVSLGYHAIWMLNTWPVILSHSTFRGPDRLHAPPNVTECYILAAVKFTLHNVTESRWSAPAEDPCNPTSMLATAQDVQGLHSYQENDKRLIVYGCTFHKLGLEPLYKIYFRFLHYQKASALHIEVDDPGEVTDFDVVIRDCTFVENSSPYDTTVKIYLGSAACHNSVHVDNCQFYSGWAYKGGAIFFLFRGKSNHNEIVVRKSNFTANKAYLSGGAIAFSLQQQYKENVITIDGCLFHSNIGGSLFPTLVGGAITIQSRFHYRQQTRRPANVPLPKLYIENCNFINNSAAFGAALFVGGTQLHLQNITAEGNHEGDCLHATNAIVVMDGRQIWVNNSGALRGGVVGLYDYSVLTLEKSVFGKFSGNSAMTEGGVLFADKTSSTLDISDSILLTSNVGLPKLCYLDDGVGGLNLTTETAGYNGQIVFHENSALRGYLIYSHSMTACLNHNKHTAHTHFSLLSDKLLTSNGAVATGPVWAFFWNTSCDCLKPMADNHDRLWYYPGGCDRQTVYNDLLPYQERIGLEQFHHGIRKFFANPDVSGYGTFPGSDFFASPWAVTAWTWHHPRGINREIDRRLPNTSIIQSWIGNLTLYPAPGEMFVLNSHLADVVLQHATGTGMMMAQGDVLIRYAGKQYQPGSNVYLGLFTNVEVALAGVPGTIGSLLLATEGQIYGGVIVLEFPFRLRPCHLGYSEKPLMGNGRKEEATRYMRSFKTRSIQSEPGSNTEELVCNCDMQAGVQSCVRGRDLVIKDSYWAGGTSRMKALPQRNKKEDWSNIGDLEKELRHQKFLIGLCYASLCTKRDDQGWTLNTEDPCAGWTYRQGIKCGQCKNGYSRTPGLPSQACSRCDDDDVVLGRISFFLGTFFYASFGLLLMVYFRVGQSATFESWVTYDQLCAFIHRREYNFLTVTTAVTPAQCLSRNLSTSEQIATLYYTPVCFLLWIIIIFQLSRLTTVHRLIVKLSAINTIWVLISFSYASLIYPSFELLSCYKFNGQFVLHSDSITKCFGKEHWPYGLLALVVLFGIVIPIPLLLFLMKSSPRLKPLVDVYMSYVKAKYRWWIAVSMARRLMVAVLAAFIANPLIRQTVLATVVQVMLFVLFALRPYKSGRSNIIEAAMLGNCCIFAMINVVPPNTDWNTVAVAVFLWPTVLAVLNSLYRHRIRMRNDIIQVGVLIGRCCSPLCSLRRPGDVSADRQLTREQQAERAEKLYDLRDRLLGDVLADLECKESKVSLEN